MLLRGSCKQAEWETGLPLNPIIFRLCGLQLVCPTRLNFAPALQKYRMRIILCVLPLVMLMLTACDQANNAEGAREEVMELREKVNAAESEEIRQQYTRELVAQYLDYVEQFPEDSLAADYLFSAANLEANALQNFERGEELFLQVVEKYPQHERASDALFIAAFVNENVFQDEQRAEELYRRVVEEYPQDDYADDARFSLENMGRDPEELLEEIQKRAGADTVQ